MTHFERPRAVIGVARKESFHNFLLLVHFGHSARQNTHGSRRRLGMRDIFCMHFLYVCNWKDMFLGSVWHAYDWDIWSDPRGEWPVDEGCTAKCIFNYPTVDPT